MIKLTRTLHQWRTTARRLQLATIGRPDLAEQIRWALPADLGVYSSTPFTMSFLAEDAALIERLVPVPVRGEPPLRRESAADAIAAAEAIIRGHQRRNPDCRSIEDVAPDTEE